MEYCGTKEVSKNSWIEIKHYSQSKKMFAEEIIVKRILVIVMAFVMMITMFSCGNQNVESKLIEGTWVLEKSALSTQYTQTYEFEENGMVTVLFKIPMQTASVNFGTYTIESNNEIVITMEDNDPPPYSFYYTSDEDGSLRLFDDEEHTEELYHKK